MKSGTVVPIGTRVDVLADIAEDVGYEVNSDFLEHARGEVCELFKLPWDV